MEQKEYYRKMPSIKYVKYWRIRNKFFKYNKWKTHLYNLNKYIEQKENKENFFFKKRETLKNPRRIESMINHRNQEIRKH